MTIESDIKVLIDPLCGGRCYLDVAPPLTTRPYVTFQQVGGRTIPFLEGGAPVKRNARIQVNVWADSRITANELMRDIEDAILSAPIYGRALGALFSRYEEVSKLRGAQQDFSCWHT